MTWIEVASDAVKIGLGAFVAGIFAVLIAFFNHRFKTKEKSGNRRRKAINEAIDTFEEVALSTMNEVRSLRAENESEDLNDLLYSSGKPDDAKLRSRGEEFRALEKMEYRLVVLGFERAAAEVASYKQLFLKVEYLEEGREHDRYSRFESQLEAKQIAVLKKLSAAYKSI